MSRYGIYSTLGGLAVAACFVLNGCASPREAIDRVQPNYVDKQALAGKWYYQRTVTDMPAANGFTFIGATDTEGLSRISWDIQEKFLFARRTTELIKNADGLDTIVENDEHYQGEVMAAFRIEKHFDIARPYNDTTGEQLNVLVENSTDRPWHERRYMRIDWSANLVHNYNLDFESESIESVPYFVQEYDPVTGERHPDAPNFDFDDNYFDVTTKLFAKGGTIEMPGYGKWPLCRLDELVECGSSEYSIRHSFKSIDLDNPYEPRPYKGKQTNLFGFFSTDRLVYNGKTGILEQSRERYLNRFNIWQRSFENGVRIDPAEREPKPIVYHVNTDWPKDDSTLLESARAVADQWNQVLVNVVKATGNSSLGEKRMFILCENNPVEEGDPEECGPAGRVARIGDLRYSLMAYIPKYMTYGLLGFGPANVDPETGEIISGMVYVYQHNNLAAYRVQEMVQLLTGDLDPSAFIDGVNLQAWVIRSTDRQKTSRTYGLDEAGDLIRSLSEGPAVRYWDSVRRSPDASDVDFQRTFGPREWLNPYMHDLYNRRTGLRGDMDSSQGKLARLKGTAIEDMLLNDDILAGMGINPLWPVSEQLVDQASIARGGFARFAAQRERVRHQFAHQRNMSLPEMVDDGLLGLARELAGQGLSQEELYAALRGAIYRSVMAHELGHTLGLRHNFAGSEDAINYFGAYWEIRDPNAAQNLQPRLGTPLSDEEINQKLYNYAYSSVMDYAGHQALDEAGPGKYDQAAMIFGYADKVEVFADTETLPLEDFRDWFQSDGQVLRFGQTEPESLHYTHYYNAMGPKLYETGNRVLVDFSELTEDLSADGSGRPRVPYIYCSDSRVDLGDHCLSGDLGADAGERMKNLLDNIDTWYITRNFPRGQIGSVQTNLDHRPVGPDNPQQSNFVASNYTRIYGRLKHWNDTFALYKEILPRFYDSEDLADFYADPVNGWGVRTWSVQNAFNKLVQTILMPNVGSYSEETLFEGSALLTQSFGNDPNAVELGVDQARFFSTSWDNSNYDCGYQWWECLHHVGFYLDKIMAIEALTDTHTKFIGRETPADLREWRIGYYNTFPEQISLIGAAILSDGRLTQPPALPLDQPSRSDWLLMGPEIDNQGQLVFPNYASLNYGSAPVPGDPVKAIDPHASFSVKLYWQILGMARFSSTFDQSFSNESRLYLMGAAGSPIPAGANVASYLDPITWLSYGAIRRHFELGSFQQETCNANALNNFPDNDCPKTAGEAIIDRANELLAWSIYCDDDGFTTPNNIYDNCVYDDSLSPTEKAAKQQVATARFLELNEIVKTMVLVDRSMDWGDRYEN
jgi:hypothetical protein